MERLFLREYKQFFRLDKAGRIFFLTVFLYDLLMPIYAIFANAFLWRKSHDITIIIMYHLCMFAFLSVGYYLNGILLKRYSVKVLYFSGALFKALCLAFLLFLPTVNLPIVMLYGALYGLGLGIFWSNRNLLHLELTKSTNRIYFSSMDFLSRTFSQVIVPAVIGYFLIFGTKQSLYTTEQGYYIVGIVTLILSILFGTVIKKIKAPANPVSHIRLGTRTEQWNYARGILLLLGLFEGVYLFIPILMILTLIGQEDVLGVTKSAAAVLGGIIVYTIARSINTRHRLKTIQASIFLAILGSCIISILYNPLGIFAFLAIITIAQTMLATECNALIFDLIDKETKGVAEDRFAYIFDYDFMLNIGRFFSVLLFAVYLSLFSLDFALRFSPLIFAGTYIFLAFFARSLLRPKQEQSLVGEPTTLQPQPAGEKALVTNALPQPPQQPTEG